MKIIRPKSKHPLPKKAKRVFKGIIFDVYQWQQQLFDGSHATFEKLKRPDTVNILPITQDKKIILTKQHQPGHQPFIGSAGGRIDPGEAPLAAAKRELLEETGYKAKQWILWDVVQPIPKIDWAIYTFIAKQCSKVAQISLDAGEKISLNRVSFPEYIKLVAQESYRDQEISLKILKIKQDPVRFKQLRHLFLG